MVFKFSSVLLVLLFFHFLVAFRLQASEAQSWIKAAYWFYGSEFPIADINSALFTHLIYAFAGLNSLSYELSLSSDSEEQDQKQHYSTFSSTVKQKNPSVTTLISIGGGNADYSVFSTLVSNSSHRKTFIDSSIKIARLYGFQGLDLCWVSANTSSDMTNMGNLFQEWRAAVKSEAANSSQAQLILTAAVQYKPDLESFSFPVESIRNNLNWAGLPRGEQSVKKELLRFTLWGLSSAILFGFAYQFGTFMPLAAVVLMYCIAVSSSLLLFYAYYIVDDQNHTGCSFCATMPPHSSCPNQEKTNNSDNV